MHLKEQYNKTLMVDIGWISTRYFQVLCNIGKGLSKSVKLVFLSEKIYGIVFVE